MTATTSPQDAATLSALALALVTQPRASLQELAKAIGVSKATLYRFCRTREQLVARLIAHSMDTMNRLLQQARLDEDDPIEALRRLTALQLEHRELAAFLTYYWKEADASLSDASAAAWDAQMDAFFLRGQQQGVFRIDFSAAALTEIWVAAFIGLADAERRGRVAHAGLGTLLERAFLQGTLAETACE